MTEKYERNSPFRVMLNQAGYLPDMQKTTVLPFACDRFLVKNEAGEVCLEGKPVFFGKDQASGDEVYQADFSALHKDGRYFLEAGGERSATFAVGERAYEKLFFDVMKAYYFLRCGCELEEKYAGAYTHGKCHTAKALVWDEPSCEVDAPGGWHDAGDYGRYITAGACALAHLLFAYRLFPEVFQKVELQIPESGNGVPDILNECRYELEWFLKMQREDGGVYHKLTTARHAPFIMPQEDTEQLYVLPVSSMATADLAAVCALAAEVYEPYDRQFAKTLTDAAQRSYDWLRDHPDFLGFSNPEGCDTGWYGERDDDSNRYWAAAQMYALTGEKQYEDDMRACMQKPFPPVAFGYTEMAGFGVMGYLLSKQQKAQDLKEKMLEDIRAEAERLKGFGDACGYQVAMSPYDYCWGSNMNVMKNAMAFVLADVFCGETQYRVYAQRQLHYLLGCNALGVSYVTGNGDFCCNYPHLRPADQDGVEACMPGMVSGGPNSRPADPLAVELLAEGTPPMKCYIDHVFCYSLNEITIYWNSPAVFTLAYLLSK